MSSFDFSSLFLITLSCFCVNVMCNAITFEEYEELEGESFCSTRNRNFHITMCVEIAALNSIEGYRQESIVAECTSRPLKLFKADGNRAPNRSEVVLDCRYDGPTVYNYTIGAYTNSFHYARALGRGISKKDVMEYKYEGEYAVPFENRENLLNEI